MLRRQSAKVGSETAPVTTKLQTWDRQGVHEASQDHIDSTVKQWFERIISRQRASVLTQFWSLPLSIVEVVDRDLRRQWVTQNVRPTAQIPQSEVDRATQYLASLSPHPVEDPSTGVSLQTLQALAKAVLSAGLPYEQVFNQPAQTMAHPNGSTIWLFPVWHFPEWAPDASVGEYQMRFAHFSSPWDWPASSKQGWLCLPRWKP